MDKPVTFKSLQLRRLEFAPPLTFGQSSVQDAIPVINPPYLHHDHIAENVNHDKGNALMLEAQTLSNEEYRMQNGDFDDDHDGYTASANAPCTSYPWTLDATTNSRSDDEWEGLGENGSDTAGEEEEGGTEIGGGAEKFDEEAGSEPDCYSRYQPLLS